MTTVFIIIGIIITALVVVLIVLGMRASKLTEELELAEQKAASLAVSNRELQANVTALEAENKKKIGWLDAMEEELNWHKAELEKRPKLDRKVYKILTLGMKATGKSSLTLKWSNPLVDLGTIEGTKIERYERTVSHVRNKDTLVEHLFEVHDWGGEHIVDAQQELIIEEIHGLLIVVDLGGKDARQVDMARVSEQLNEFNPQALKYFFSPKTVASCKSVVLFINKSDLIAGPPAQAEMQAKQLYQPLIDTLEKYATQIDVKVLVGSASYGHSTHVLFSHFVERILPRNAYDNQLLQRMKQDLRMRERAQTFTGQPPPSFNGAPPTSASQPALPAPQIPHAPPPTNGQPHPNVQFAQAAQHHTPAPQAPVLPNYGTPGVRPAANRGTAQMPTLPNTLADTAPLMNRPPLPRKG